MKIDFLNLKAQYLELKTELDETYHRFMNSGNYVLGEEVLAFESEFAQYSGAKYCVGVSSGLDALCLALEVAGIGAGDEVIVPANTYIATWLAVSQVGAIPIPVEPDPKTYNIDSKLINVAITEKTRAILPVHLYGRPVEMEPINLIADKNGLIVIEDNAQSQGALYNGKYTGNLGDMGAVSFYPSKNLGAFGEAGAVVTNNKEYANQIKLLRNYGSQKKYYNEEKGYNRRIDALQAAFLRVKLRRLDKWNSIRKTIAKEYSNSLIGCKLPSMKNSDSVWHQYIIQIKNRDEFQRKLKDIGIPTMVHYPVPPHLSEAYSDLGFKKGSFPITEQIAKTCLSLPIGPHMSLQQCEYVIRGINTTISKENFYN